MPLIMPGFGRRVVIDERDKNYPMRLLLDPLKAVAFPRGAPIGVRHHIPGIARWVQGQTGTCVEHGWRHLVEGSPIRQKMPYAHFDFYRKIIQRDEWGDNDFEATAPTDQLQSGTSVRAGAEQLKDDGLITNYLWASLEDPVTDIREWTLLVAGGVFGLPWMTGMMHPDSEGFIHATGREEGGHCVAEKGWSDRIRIRGKLRPGLRAVRIMNSWHEWGYAWLPEDDLAKLMEMGGEFCAPTEVRVTPLKVVP